VSELTSGIIGKMIYTKSYIYIDTSLYDSFIIICNGYNSGAVVNDRYTISNYTNYIERFSEGNAHFNLYKKDNSYCIEIPDNAVAFVGKSSYFGMLSIENALREGYKYYPFT
jgi:hypothetical protein